MKNQDTNTSYELLRRIAVRLYDTGRIDTDQLIDSLMASNGDDISIPDAFQSVFYGVLNALNDICGVR